MSRKRSAPTPVEEDFSPLEAPEDPEEQEPQERAVRGKPRKKTKSAADDDEEYYRSLAKGLDIEDDEDDMSESEIPAPQTKRSDDCEAGHIQSIYVENFMCHRKFSIDLRPGLNFIVGKNGSGKSAVAAAIQLCLGGTARNTGRGSSTRSMVREGSEKPALVRVTMLNTGSDAYRPEVYGDRIIIERKIARSGGVGGYSIRGSKDKKTEISNSKSELDKILRTFNILVDNPCCVLTQDESKRFIQGNTNQKYDFFLKATGLHNLREELLVVHNNTAEAKVLLVEHAGRLEKKRAEMEQIKAKYDRLVHLDTLQDKINLCVAKTHWSDVNEAQEVVLAAHEESERSVAELAKINADFQAASGSDTNQAEEMKAVEEEINSLQQQQEEVTEEINRKQAVYSAAARKYEGIKQTLTQKERSTIEYRERLRRVNKEIADLREKALIGAKAEERAIMDQIDHITATISERRADEEGTRREKNELSQRVMRLQNDQQSLRVEEDQVRNEINRLKNEQRMLAGSGSNRAAMFGQEIAGLCTDLRRESFRGPVFGPVGAFVTMRDGVKEWAPALERAIGPLLRSFIVTNAEDREKLTSLGMRRNMRGLQVITQMPHERYNVHRLPEEAREVILVQDCLLIPDDLIFNCLVDQLNIDRTFLAKTEDLILAKFVSGTMGHQTLKFGLLAGIDEKCNMTKFVNGNHSSESNRFPFRNQLAADTTEMLDSIARTIVEKEAGLRQLQERAPPLVQEVRAGRAQLDDMDARLSRLNKEMSVLNRQKRDADSKLAEQQEAGRIDTSAMEQESEDLEQSIKSLENSIEFIKVELEDAKKHTQACLEDKRRTEAQRGELVEALKMQANKIEDLMRQRRLVERKLSGFKKRVEDKEAEVSRLQDRLQVAQSALEGKTARAVEQTRELVKDWDEEPLVLRNNESKLALEKRVKELKAELAQGRSEAGLRGESLAQVKVRYERAKTDCDEAAQAMAQVKENLEAMEEDEETRRVKWKKALKNNTTSTKEKFDNYAQAKGASGTVDFNHVDRTLEVTFQVDNSDESTIRNDVRNLSGGERSFVTFSLLLALGHVIETPFRLLDEYDVYMDEPTRKLTLDTLKEYTQQRDQRNRQFIILTPHTLGDLRTGPLVNIQSMPEPVRNSAHGLQQTTVDFQPAEE